MLLLWGLLPASECTTANGGGVATGGGGVATGGTLYMCHDEGCGWVGDSRDHP